METMRLRAIQQPGNAGALLDSLIRTAGNLPCDCRIWVRIEKYSWQRCNE